MHTLAVLVRLLINPNNPLGLHPREGGDPIMKKRLQSRSTALLIKPLDPCLRGDDE
jgi:hypothetical protein